MTCSNIKRFPFGTRLKEVNDSRSRFLPEERAKIVMGWGTENYPSATVYNLAEEAKRRRGV